MLIKMILLMMSVGSFAWGVELVVVRHGETDWNEQGRLQGHVDVELNATGVEQAKRTGQKLSGEVFEAVYTSDLNRAKVTGGLIVEKLETPPRQGFFTDSRIREKNFGELEGKHFFSEEVKRMVQDGSLHGESGVEANEEFRKRIHSFLKDLAENYSDESKVLVVTHGGVVRVLMNEGGYEGYAKVPNASISRFKLHSRGRLEILESAQEPLPAIPPG